MRCKIPDEQLVRMISRYATRAVEARQIGRRLLDLLPTRFAELKRGLAREARGADADRLVLTDPRWLELIEESVDMQGRATLARIQYETHMMLHAARRSLRGLDPRQPRRTVQRVDGSGR